MKNAVDRIIDVSRSWVIAKRRSAKLKSLTPFWVVRQANAWRSRQTSLRGLYAPVRERSSVDNVFHCCVHKTGSVWVKSLLVDLATYRYCGLAHYHYQSRRMRGRDPRPIGERTFDKAFPSRSIVSPMYMRFDNFSDIPKNGSYRAFFVGRDPRDVVVSWYFSTKVSHVLQGSIRELRPRLQSLPKADGLILSIEHLIDYGLFDALDSWVGAEAVDPNVLVLSYEQLIDPDSFGTFRKLFDHLDFRMPDEALRDLIHTYSFERVTGRKRGEEVENQQLRKAQAGDWHNHFDDRVAARFEELVGDLPQRMGYE